MAVCKFNTHYTFTFILGNRASYSCFILKEGLLLDVHDKTHSPFQRPTKNDIQYIQAKIYIFFKHNALTIGKNNSLIKNEIRRDKPTVRRQHCYNSRYDKYSRKEKKICKLNKGCLYTARCFNN